MNKNALYYGDNLDVLRRHIRSASVDLVYLDPPFKSDQDYNVLFGRREGHPAEAQIQAFEDTWQWDHAAAAAYAETVELGGRVSRALQAFRTLMEESDMLAYLSMMAPRLVELRRVMKDGATLWLHCDPTASHYLKLLLDAVFGPEHFRNEVVWRRTTPKGLMSQRLPTNHDVILVVQKGAEASWNEDAMFVPYDPDNLPDTVAAKYTQQDADGRLFQLTSLLNPNKNRPNLEYEFLGVTRVWRWTRDRMQNAYDEGRVVQTAPGRVPRYKRYLDEQRGLPLGDVWTDIPPINARAAERLGYPTQKPEALLHRILSLASQPGAVVLDPFCGCGTTVAAAQALGLQWIGIDVTHLAINLIKHRLSDTYGPDIVDSYEVIGEPVSVDGAEELAASDPYQFQFWALGLVGARPHEEKKGADRGIDGRLYFHDEGPKGKTKQVIISVKAGKTGPAHVRDLRGVVDRESAQIGVLITFQEPTGPMRKEAASADFYESPWGRHPRIQLLTVADLLDGERIDYPAITGANVTYQRAPRQELKVAEQRDLLQSN